MINIDTSLDIPQIIRIGNNRQHGQVVVYAHEIGSAVYRSSRAIG